MRCAHAGVCGHVRVCADFRGCARGMAGCMRVCSSKCGPPQVCMGEHGCAQDYSFMIIRLFWLLVPSYI